MICWARFYMTWGHSFEVQGFFFIDIKLSWIRTDLQVRRYRFDKKKTDAGGTCYRNNNLLRM